MTYKKLMFATITVGILFIGLNAIAVTGTPNGNTAGTTAGATSAQNATTNDILYTNGYITGKSLADHYQGADQQTFIHGLMVGLGKEQGNQVSESDIKQIKQQWFEQKSLSETDKTSYAVGYRIGAKSDPMKAVIDPFDLVQGVFDGLQTRNQEFIDDKKAQSLSLEYTQHQYYKNKETVAKLATQKEKDGKDFLDKNAKNADVKVTDSGLQYKVIQAGNGKSPTLDDFVNVEIVAKKIDGTVFYDSKNQKGPIHIKVDETIPGWKEALVQMQPGAEWVLYLPAKLAYGNAGWQNAVLPGETVIYDVKLVSVDNL